MPSERARHCVGQGPADRGQGRGGPVLLAVQLADVRDRPAITVKRTAGGYASNWILVQVRAGTVLAGSGITPVMSILRSALAAGRGRVVLVYANRDERSVIFGPELRRLVSGSGGRLVVVHWLDSLLGVPSAAAMAALARPYCSAETFICGPDPNLALVREALGRLGGRSRRGLHPGLPGPGIDPRGEHYLLTML